MSATAPETRAAARDRLGEIASIGAGHAAGALAGMLGGTFCMGVPRVVSTSEAASSEAGVVCEQAAVRFGLEGPLPGTVVWLLPARAAGQLLARVAGGVGAASPEGSSALRELGNIVVSHLASAIGELLEAVVLPTPPELHEPGDGVVLPAGTHIEVDVYERGGAIETTLVLIPSHATL